MTSQFTLQTNFTEPDLLQIDVMASGLPEDFLGTGFDLVVPGKWGLERSEFCGVFDEQTPDVFKIVTPDEANRRIVTGVAVAGGKYKKLHDGCLIRFFFQFETGVREHSIGFERTVLSVYKNGRRDVSDVEWKNGALDLPERFFISKEVTLGTEKAGAGSQEQTLETQQIVGPTVSEGIMAGRVDLLSSLDQSIVNVYTVILLGFGVLLAVFGLTLAYFRLKSRQ